MADISLADVVYSNSAECYGSFDYSTSIIIIILSCVLGIVWAAINFIQVRAIKVDDKGGDSQSALVDNITDHQRKLLIELGDKIATVSYVLFREPSSF